MAELRCAGKFPLLSTGNFPHDIFPVLRDNARMVDDHESFIARVDEKLEQHGLNDRQASLAVTGRPDLLRDLRRKRSVPRGDRLNKLADVLGTTTHWLLHGHDDGEDRRRAELGATRVRSEVAGTGLVGFGEVSRSYRGEQPLAPLPHLGTAMGGEFPDEQDLDGQIEMTELHLNEVLQYLRRPASLANDSDAYVLTIIGDSMWPRFRPGRQVIVSPRSPAVVGDDVIVQLRGEEGESERIKMVLIKELVRRSSTFVELRQFNPDITFRIPAARVAALHKVVGEFF
jgi:hypothetical protein